MNNNTLNKTMRFMFFVTTAILVMAFAKEIKAEKVYVKSIVGNVQCDSSVVKMGMKIDSDMSIVVSNNSSIILLSQDGFTMTLKKGTYKINELLKQSRILRKTKNKLSRNYLNETDNGTPTAVAGVRGDDVSKINKNELKRDLYWEN